MNAHTQISDLLPLYVSGALDRDQRKAVEDHISGCTECQADLRLWKSVAGEIATVDQAVAAPRGLADQALAQVGQLEHRPAGVVRKLEHMFALLRSQMPLVQREIWPASAGVIGLGYIVAVMASQSAFIYALAPLIAATCISLIYGSENDAAFELALSTPTSPRQILLARLVLVFGYNLALVLVAALGLTLVLHQSLAAPLLLAWLAPMTFLSAASLVISLWVGTPTAITVTYVAWLVKLLAGVLPSPEAGLHLSAPVTQFLSVYQGFWQATGPLLALSAVLLGAAMWLAGRQEHGLINLA